MLLKKVEYAKPTLLCHPKSQQTFGHRTGCSNCGCAWGLFYRQLPFMGPPNYCPWCGAMNQDRSGQLDARRIFGLERIDG